MTEQSVTYWDTASIEEKRDRLMDKLALFELYAADPAFAEAYVRAKMQTKDWADRMRLDIEMVKRVIALRQEGKMRNVASLRTIAENIAPLPFDQVVKALHEFSESLKK